MATLIAYQDGNFTGATTFKALVGGTGSAQTSIAGGFTNTTTSYVNSVAFTITNGNVVEGVLVRGNRLTTSGTVSVALSDDNGTTQTREVTINASDMPADESWIFIKFGTTLTGDGGNDYRLQIKSSVNANARFTRGATAGDWWRLFRSNATATIATTDDVYIVGERTGAGAVTTVTVTMDSTATTSYGNVIIGDAGTLAYGTSASTNYYLRLAGNLQIRGNGTLNIGTSTTRIPSTSTATLEFNCASNVQFGLDALDGSTVNIYGAEKANTKVLLTADANSGQAVITVEDTTGWANGDQLGIASTTTTSTQNELRTISSIGSATQATMTANLSFAHSGTAPFQAEVVNVTRNVKIRGTSASLNSYINCAATSNFTADNAEFFFLGSATALKRGINAGQTTGTFSMSYCGMWTWATGSLLFLSGTAVGTVSHCVCANNPSGLALIAGTNFNVEDCWLQVLNNGIIAQASTTIKNTRISGASNRGIQIELAAGVVYNSASFSGNVIHSCNDGLSMTAQVTGEIATPTIWRCTTGIINTSAQTALQVTDGNLYNNTTQASLGSGTFYFKNCDFDNFGGNTTTTQIVATPAYLNFEECDFGQTNTATNFFSFSVANSRRNTVAIFNKCRVAETLAIGGQSNLISTPDGVISYIGFDKLNNTSGNHRAYKQFGYAGSDQSVFRTASPSEVLVPNNATGKLPSGSKKFGVANGNSATVSVWVRKSSTYNGNEPRLILKRNIVGGVSSDQVLATLSGGTEEWLELTASTPTVTDDCVLEVYVDCDGNAGTVNVDDYSIT
jgi:hypothetical protein